MEKLFKGLKLEKLTEIKIQSIRKEFDSGKIKGRLNVFKDALNTEYLNKEERDALISTCELYSDIFYLEGDKFTCTNAVFHEVKTS